MTNKRREFPEGIRLRPSTNATTAQGEERVDSADNKKKIYLDGSERAVLTEDQAQTVENKTMDATAATGNNTLSADSNDIVYDNSTSGLTATDVKNALDELKTGLDNQNEASEISYDNTTSGLTATDVQAAIDELDGLIDTINGSTYVNSFNSRTGAVVPAASDYDADQVDYDNSTSGLSATDVQGAVDEVEGRVDTIEAATYVNSFNSRTGAVSPAASDYDADQVDFDNATSGLTATEVQGALDEIDGDLDAHVAASIAHGTTGNLVGTSDAQVITNKDIDGGTASNTSRVTIPKDTKANLDLLTRKEGTVVYATDEDQAYIDDGTQLVPIGSSEGGVVNFDPLGTMEQAQTSDFSNSGGTLSITETGSEVGRGDKSLKFVATVASQTFQRDNLGIPLGYRNNGFLGFKFQASITEDVTVSLYDVTNSAELMSEVIIGNGEYKPYEFIVGLPSSCEEVYWKFESSAADTILVDDVVLTPDMSAFKEVSSMQVVEENILSSDFTTASAEITDLTFDNLIVGERYMILSQFLMVTDSSAGQVRVDVENGATTIGRVNWNSPSSTSSGAPAFAWSSGIFTATDNEVTFTTDVDVFTTRYIAGDGTKSTTFAQLIKVDSDAIVTNTTNIAPVKYSTNAGNSVTASTVVYLDFEDKLFDDDLQVLGAGSGNVTVSGTGWRMKALRSGYLDLLSRIRYASGTLNQNNEFLLEVYVNGSSVSNLDYQVVQANTGAGFAMSLNGNDEIYVQRDDIIEIVAIQNAGALSLNTVPGQNYVSIKWSDRNFTVNAALPATVTYTHTTTGSNNGGSSSTNTVQTRSIAYDSGDKSFSSENAGQVTIQPGKYRISGFAVAFRTNSHQSFVYGVTDGQPIGELIGSSELAASGDSTTTTSHIPEGVITISESKIYELRHYTETAQAANGLGPHTAGRTGNTSAKNIYASLTITKLR